MPQRRFSCTGTREVTSELVDLWAAGCILYTMLSGYQPFYSPIVSELMELIKAGTYDFTGPVWEKISDNAKDLVSQLLQTDPSKRATVHMALAHPWITKPDDPKNSQFSGQQFKLNLLRNQRRLTRNLLPGLVLGKRISEASSFLRFRNSSILNALDPRINRKDSDSG